MTQESRAAIDQEKMDAPYVSRVIKVSKQLLAFLAAIAIIALLALALDSRANVKTLNATVATQAQVIDRRSVILEYLGCRDGLRDASSAA